MTDTGDFDDTGSDITVLYKSKNSSKSKVSDRRKKNRELEKQPAITNLGRGCESPTDMLTWCRLLLKSGSSMHVCDMTACFSCLTAGWWNLLELLQLYKLVEKRDFRNVPGPQWQSYIPVQRSNASYFRCKYVLREEAIASGPQCKPSAKAPPLSGLTNNPRNMLQ